MSGTFIDIKTLKPIEYALVGEETPGGIGLGVRSVRVSANGKVFGSWRTVNAPSGIQTVVLEGYTRRHYYSHTDSYHVIPGPDGKIVFTCFNLWTDHARTVIGERRDEKYGCRLPAHQGSYYLTVTFADNRRDDRQQRDNISLHIVGDDRALASITDVDVGRGNGDFTLDKRIHLIPQANMLITIAATNDKLILHRFAVEEALQKSGIDLLITSQPLLEAKPDAGYVYQLNVLSRKGDVKYRLESGPEGMAISPKGQLTWHVPASYDKPINKVSVVATDASGQECFH